MTERRDDDTAQDQALVALQQRGIPPCDGADTIFGRKVTVPTLQEICRNLALSYAASGSDKVHWEECGILGKGAFGLVKMVRNRLDHQVFARKEITMLLHMDALSPTHKALREIRAIMAVGGKHVVNKHVVSYHHAYLDRPDAPLDMLLSQLMLFICLHAGIASSPQPLLPLPAPEPPFQPVAISPLPCRPASPSSRSRPPHRPIRNATSPASSRPNAQLRRSASTPARRRRRSPNTPILNPTIPIIEVASNAPCSTAAVVATPHSIEHPPTPPSTTHSYQGASPHPALPPPLFAHAPHHRPRHLSISTSRPAAPFDPHLPPPACNNTLATAGTPSSSLTDCGFADSPTLGLLSHPTTPPSPLSPPAAAAPGDVTLQPPPPPPLPPNSTLVATLFLAALLVSSRPPQEPNAASTTDSSRPGVQGLTTTEYDGDTNRAEKIQEKQRQGYQLKKVCILMELIHGPTLQQWLEARNEETQDSVCTGERELSIVRQIVAGIFHIHSQAYLHRDIKPANIYLHLPPRRRSFSSDPPADPAAAAGGSPPATPPAAQSAGGGAGPRAPPPPPAPPAASAIPSFPAINLAAGTKFSVDADYCVKIGDFGLAVPVDDGECAVRFEDGMDEEAGGEGYGTPDAAKEYRLRERSGGVGTITYQAPEMRRGPPGRGGAGGRQGGAAMYGRSVDMYALGLTMIEVFMPLRTGHERHHVFAAAKSQERKLPALLCERRPDIADLISSLLDPDPTKRPVARDVLNHPALNPPQVPDPPLPSNPITPPAAPALATMPAHPAMSAPKPFAAPVQFRLGSSAPDCLLSPSPPSKPPSPRGAAADAPRSSPRLRSHHTRNSSVPHAMPPPRQQQLLAPAPHAAASCDLSDQSLLPKPPLHAAAAPITSARSPPSAFPSISDHLLPEALIEQNTEITRQLHAARRAVAARNQKIMALEQDAHALRQQLRTAERRIADLEAQNSRLRGPRQASSPGSRLQDVAQVRAAEQDAVARQLRAQLEAQRLHEQQQEAVIRQLRAQLEVQRPGEQQQQQQQRVQEAQRAFPRHAPMGVGGLRVGLDAQAAALAAAAGGLKLAPQLPPAPFAQGAPAAVQAVAAGAAAGGWRAAASVPAAATAFVAAAATASPRSGAGAAPALAGGAAAAALGCALRQGTGQRGPAPGRERADGDDSAAGLDASDPAGAGAKADGWKERAGLQQQHQLLVDARSMSATSVEELEKAGGHQALHVGPRSASTSAVPDEDQRAGPHHCYPQQHLQGARAAAGGEEPLRGSQRPTPADLATLHGFAAAAD